MEKYTWPGNVRELEHVIAASMSLLNKHSSQIELVNLPPHIAYKFAAAGNKKPLENFRLPLPRMIERLEKELVNNALERNNWSISRTARELGIKRQSLQYRIKKYSL